MKAKGVLDDQNDVSEVIWVRQEHVRRLRKEERKKKEEKEDDEEEEGPLLPRASSSSRFIKKATSEVS